MLKTLLLIINSGIHHTTLVKTLIVVPTRLIVTPLALLIHRLIFHHGPHHTAVIIIWSLLIVPPQVVTKYAVIQLPTQVVLNIQNLINLLVKTWLIFVNSLSLYTPILAVQTLHASRVDFLATLNRMIWQMNMFGSHSTDQ